MYTISNDTFTVDINTLTLDLHPKKSPMVDTADHGCVLIADMSVTHGEVLSLIQHINKDLMYDISMDRLVSDILHSTNQKSLVYNQVYTALYEKEQPIIGISTQQQEIVNTQAYVKQNIDPHAQLHYLGLSIHANSHMTRFEHIAYMIDGMIVHMSNMIDGMIVHMSNDNEYMVDSATPPRSHLHLLPEVLTIHLVRGAIKT